MNVWIVGAGLTGCVLAERFSKIAKVTLVDRRNHIGGNCYDYYNRDGILIHKYGPHVFHTNSTKVWNYLSQFTSWRYYKHITKVFADGKIHLFPLEQKMVNLNNIDKTNAETFLISSVGVTNYEKFFKNYTIKQWDLHPSELSYEVVSRIPIRKNGDRYYFQDKLQGIPKYGYTEMFNDMLDSSKITLILQSPWTISDYRLLDLQNIDLLIWTGQIDEYFEFEFGHLNYRSLRFEHETLDQENYQSTPQINYPNDFDFTRILEWKYLTGQKHHKTTITREYPTSDGDPFYPIICDKNKELYLRYEKLASKERKTHFIGRLAEYKYYNMDTIIEKCLSYAEKWN